MAKMRLLFVCLGNICRSPAAEGIMIEMVRRAGLSEQIECDSAGTSGYHEGEPADARMRSHAKERGYHLPSLSRPVRAPEDFQNFDLILTMDKSNYQNVLRLDSTGAFHHKVVPMTKYCRIHNISDVPDPYYDGDDGFRLVLDILEDACGELLDRLKVDLNRTKS